MHTQHLWRTALFTLISVAAFGANAIFCRWALGDQLIDAMSFTSLRLGSAALSLFIVLQVFHFTQKKRQTSAKPASRGSWYAALVLFLYAVTFSYGYIHISTGTGALLLAGIVQFTMIGYALLKGDRLHRAEWVGILLAFFGLVYLVYPKLATPSLIGLVLMSFSAFAWALYTLNGRQSKNPLNDTAYNFYRTLPMLALASLLSLFLHEHLHLTAEGIGIAILSGALTTGLGYIFWYSALPLLSASVASAAQLLVPLFAALGAVWLIDEPLTLTFLISASLLLGGLGLVIYGRQKHKAKKSST